MDHPWGAVMAHHAPDMAMMEGGAKRFGKGIGNVNDSGYMEQNDFMVRFPLLDSKMLDINMARTGSGAIGVDHKYSSCIIFV